MYRIGILTTRNSMRWVKALEQEKPAQCEFTYIPYESLEHAKDLYVSGSPHFDGFIFSGEIPYFYIQNNVQDLLKPIGCFEVMQKDFYKALSQVMYKKPGFAMKRAFVDFLFVENHYMGLWEWLPEEDFPYIHDQHIKSYTVDGLYDHVMGKIIDLWKRGEIDHVFTRLSNLPDLLKPYGIEPVFVHPSINSMHEQIRRLIREIDLQNLIANQVVFGNITIQQADKKTDREIEYCQIAISKAIFDFEAEQKLSFIKHRTFLNYEVITTYSDLLSITNGLSTCSLTAFFTETLSFPVRVGWGIGHTLQEARENAVQANNQIVNTNESYAHILTKDEKLIGPLGADSFLIVSNQHDGRLDSLGEELGMAPLQLQRIMAVMDKLQSNELSADDISAHLNITLRTASRILKKLEDHGIATVSYNKQKKMKGRPKKIYKIQLYERT